MKPIVVKAGLALLALCLCTSALAIELRHAQKPIRGEYIVVLQSEVDRDAKGEKNALGKGASASLDVEDIAIDMAARHDLDILFIYEHAIKGFAVAAPEASIRSLQSTRDSRIEYIEENGRVEMFPTQNNPPSWGLDRVDQRNRPLDNSYTYDTTATNVRAYIIDSGIRATHNDFGGRVLNGYTAINDGRGTSDCNGHGTHVAGTVGGSSYGVAKGVRLVPVRVFGCTGGSSNAIILAGINWVAANAVRPAVANMSLGGGANSSIDSATNNLINQGVTVVVAAGNSGANACNYSPARVSNAITVGSTTSSDSRSSFSNWGSCVNVFAPGSSIRSAWYTSNTASNTISGTSMASPHVAGVAALVLADSPSASPASVRNTIYNNATTGVLSNIGSGSPNRLVYSRFGGSQPPPPPPDCTGSGSASNLSGSAGSERRYTYSVPSCASTLTVSISGGSGDADLYVRYGAQPTTSVFDCRPYLWGNNETCTFNNPSAGTWHIMVRGYSSYSGVTLTASYE